MNDSNENKNIRLLNNLIKTSELPNNESFCGVDIITPENNEETFLYQNTEIPYIIKVYYAEEYYSNFQLNPKTQRIIDNLTELHDYIKSFVPFNIEINAKRVKSCDGYDYLMKRKYTNEPLKESIKKILKEETKGIDSFLDEISNVHNISNELKEFIKKFIENSDCKKIDFSNFKMPVMGLALNTGVLINSMALRQPLPFLLFLIFHEVSHQYQFKKYGEDVMYNCYIGDVSELEAAEFMKKTEEIADEFGARKIRELQKLELIGPYSPPQMYKNLPIQQVVMMVNNYKNDMRRKNIDSPKKVSEYFYNMVKSEL